MNLPKDWIAAVEAGATLVTASDRLSRQLQQQYAGHQLAAGREAWSRPDILPRAAFWRRLFDALHEDGRIAAQPLGNAATAAWWEQAVANSFQDQPLLQVAGAARTALDAWTLLHDWRIDPATLANDFLDEARVLHAWGTAFEEECERNAWLPDHRLPEAVIAALPQVDSGLLPRAVLLGGFLEQSPAEERRWQALRERGIEVEMLAPPDHGADAVRLACDDSRDEDRRIAAWAAGRLAEDPRQRLGIVVPDLAGRRAGLRRQLLDSLAPGWLPGFSDSALPFNFSLGEPLAQEPLARTALDWLGALAADALEFTDAARLLRAPTLAPAEEHPARYALEAELRARGYAEFSLRDFAFLAGQHGCPALQESLNRSREAFIEVRRAGKQMPSAWAREISRWLDIAGWCHPSARQLDSHEFQAREAFTGLLGRLAELDDVLGGTDISTVLGWLRRMASETLFQPRAAAAPVQVLGLFEASGMSFDAIWIAGMDDETLPAAPHPNPFLPLPLQREHGLPQSSAAREQAFAQKLFASLLRSAPAVTCSHARMEGDAERRLSPLIGALPAVDDIQPASGIADRWLATAELESLADHQAPALAASRSGGGTSVLADQSACPFRAFARHRLQATEWPTPTAGPDAMLRGSMLHGVLEKLWHRWRSQRGLRTRHESGDLDADVVEAVNAVIDDSLRRERHRWRDSLADIERERLRESVHRWVEQVELERPDFELVEIEGHPAGSPPTQDADYREGLVTVQAGPLRLSGKLDRVDRLADGSELVIDYKTGNAPAPSHFFGDRPQAPQLPAYAIARRQNGHALPAGIAVASLKTGAEGMRGILRTADPAAKSTGINGLDPVHKAKAVEDWDAAVARWETVLAALGEDFASGRAEVNPLRGACDFCHLGSLCRVHEQREEDALAEEGREAGNE